MEGSVFGGAVCAVCDERLEAEGQQPLQEQQPHRHSATRCTGGSAAGSGGGGGNGKAAGEGAAPPASCKPATAIGVILGRTTLYPTSATLTWLFSYLQEVRSADDSSMDKSGANGSEAAASAAPAAAGSTDWQKGNPQLSALLSQQAVSSGGGGAVVINGAAATAAGAVVSKTF